ncbi:hypothetical protein [Streptomyces sp. 1331.2]|uniref:hypothetical protein n=1 Tax=Streptomyces sp. 1331.2 TaxID=1938835 RepID=UPI000BD5F82E|nr:hypothetical protein [Streptomyces sp. 1331.2]SOB88435.1 hypothetical protein SAMN06272789_6716 [Streptomyces sp. 1331.2]
MNDRPSLSRRPGTALRLSAALAFLAVGATACVGGAGTGADRGEGESPGPLIPPAQALQTLDSLLEQTTAGVQPALQYWDAWPQATVQYSKGLDEHSLGYAKASRQRHVKTKVAPGKYGALLDAVRSTWQAKGYRVETGPANLQALFATTPEGNGVSITIHPAGNIDIGATVSPVPVPDGRDLFGTPTPDPVMANGNPDVVPTYEDPYWSA